VLKSLDQMLLNPPLLQEKLNQLDPLNLDLDLSDMVLLSHKQYIYISKA